MKRAIKILILLIGSMHWNIQTRNFSLLAQLARALPLRVTRGLQTAAGDREIKVVNLDTGGVRGDCYCLQPVKAFKVAVSSLGIDPEDVEDLIYGKMGMSKKPHLQAILSSEKGKHFFNQMHGRNPMDQDVEDAYQVFLDTQRKLLLEGYPIIPGCAQAEKRIRNMGITVMGTTGYPNELRDLTNQWLREQGSKLEGSFTSEEVGGQGRPYPWQIYALTRAASKVRGTVVRPWQVVTVDDTKAGIEAGRNAGNWCVGIGGTSILQNQYPGDFQSISNELLDAGAHIVVDSIVDVPDAIEAINKALKDPLGTPETYALYLEKCADTQSPT